MVEGTNVLRSCTYIFVLCKLFLEIADCHWIRNVKKPFDVWGLERYSVEHRECLSNCAQISSWTKISGGTNILWTLGLWFPTGFFSKWNTVLPREVPKSVFCMGSWQLNTFTSALVLKSFEKIGGTTNISVREIIF